MHSPSRQAAAVVGTAVVLGILGDSLLRGVPWGLGASAWFALLATFAVVVARRCGKSQWSLRWMWLPLVFSGLFVWRDSPSLRAWNTVGLMAALSFAALPAVGMCLRSSGLMVYWRSTLGTIANTIVGAARMPLADSEPAGARTGKVALLSKRVLKGILVATPLVFIFSVILMSADPLFDRVIRSAFASDFSEVVSHTLLSAILAWLVAGYFLSIASGPRERDDLVVLSGGPALGIVEVGIVLGSLMFLFLLFVVVQIEYLFGGDGMIHATEGLSYAEYARSGFFELVVVTALVVPVLLGANAVLEYETERDRQSFQALATVTLILVALIMASAVHRMFMYTEAYGLTHDRIYASVLMGWIGTVLGVFAGTVLFGSGRHFVLAATLSGFALLALLNVANPDALIARTNIARAEAGKQIDVSYLGSLSDDAVPALFEGGLRLALHDRCELLGVIVERLDDRRSGWRTWNIGRHRAALALGDVQIEAGTSGCIPRRHQAAVVSSLRPGNR